MDVTPPVRRLAVLGLGRMGAPIAARLAAAGFDVTGHDPRPDLAPAGVTPAASARDAVAGADAVLTVLPGSPELRSLMIDDALLDALDDGCVWVDCTSTVPEVADELAAAAARAGVVRLDCGLGGGPPEAAAGALTLYVGGPDDILERCRPVLDALSAQLHHLGPSGSGTLAKLLVNLLWFGQAALVGETLLLAQAAGIDIERLADVLPGSPAGSAFLADHLPALLAGDHLPAFGLDRVVEELDGLEQFARRRRSPFEASGAVTGIHRDALARFGAVDGELLGVAHLEQLAGRQLSDGARPTGPTDPSRTGE